MAVINGVFYWWRITSHGTAELVPDSPEVSAQVDASLMSGDCQYFATIEGCILHAGVKATAFERRTEPTYDALVWLETGAMVPAGEMTITKITATCEA